MKILKWGWVNITGMVGQHETERWVNMLRNLHRAALLLDNSTGVVGKSGTSADYNTGWTILANNKYLVVVSVGYFNLEKSKAETRIAIPTKSGGGSAGVIAAFILNNLN